jgi:hypothetical protein
LNSFSRTFFISSNIIACPVGIIIYNFIYHTSPRSLNVVDNCIIFTTSSCMFLVAQTVS